MNGHNYAGFWIRFGATLIDSFLVMLITGPLLYSVYGDRLFDSDTHVLGAWDVLLTYVLPAVAVIVFWIYRSATPGKMLLKLTIVDADTGNRPGVGQFIGRYLAYYVSAIPFLLGFIWVGFDRRKQGWHDKLAGTVVIRGSR